MWTAFKDMLTDFAGSKKAMVFLASVIVWATTKAGLHLTTDELTPYLVLASGYLVGQGIADHGKSAP